MRCNAAVLGFNTGIWSPGSSLTVARDVLNGREATAIGEREFCEESSLHHRL